MMSFRFTIAGAALALTLAGCAGMESSAPVKFSGGMLTDSAGMTLYTFDKDAAGSGKSVCNGPCATNWPPLKATADDKPVGSWSIVTRDEGSRQWAYKGKPVFYGLGSFSFHTGHGGKKHGDWVGMMARIGIDGKAVKSATFQFVRHNDANESVLCTLANEPATLADITKRSAPFGTQLTPQGDQVAITLKD